MSQLTIETFLQLPDDVTKLNQWIFDNIQPYIKGRVLEMNSGSGIFSSFFINRGIPLYLSDLDKLSRDSLRNRFSSCPELKDVYKIDFSRPDFVNRYAAMLGMFSTLTSLNITERGFQPKSEVENANYLLRKGGHLIIALPSQIALYPGSEHFVEELKRYDRRPLKQWLGNFRILKVRYFSFEVNHNPLSVARTRLSVIAIARKNY